MFLGSAPAGVTIFVGAARATAIATAKAGLQPATPYSNDEVRPFTIAVPSAQLVDVQERLARIR